MPDDDVKTSEQMVFDANPEEFATRIGFICALKANNKLSPAEAYQRIGGLWKQLKRSRKNLGIPKAPDTEPGADTPPAPPSGEQRSVNDARRLPAFCRARRDGFSERRRLG